ncbi:MAG: glutathione peroxidase [Paracoccus sp. (in: a-proteobacteria)]|nr:glutathione peroxidase [Paracoccus sp. (in: a-proteobacteria)]
MKRRLFLSLATAISALGLAPGTGRAEDAPAFSFPSIDGGEYDTAKWRGKPVLVVNTASLCGFAGQLTDMQALHEAYADRGLVVLAVPSDDFNQELNTGKEVSEYCQMEYGITLPVAKGDVHPFYAWVRQQTGFVPKWNFNKVLIGPDGAILGSWGSFTKPGGPQISEVFMPYLDA